MKHVNQGIKLHQGQKGGAGGRALGREPTWPRPRPGWRWGCRRAPRPAHGAPAGCGQPALSAHTPRSLITCATLAMHLQVHKSGAHGTRQTCVDFIQPSANLKVLCQSLRTWRLLCTPLSNFPLVQSHTCAQHIRTHLKTQGGLLVEVRKGGLIRGRSAHCRVLRQRRLQAHLATPNRASAPAATLDSCTETAAPSQCCFPNATRNLLLASSMPACYDRAECITASTRVANEQQAGARHACSLQV